jgi:hypothetical protein
MCSLTFDTWLPVRSRTVLAETRRPLNWNVRDASQNQRKLTMNIGEAIEAMKVGKKASGPSWNGKDMYLYIETRQGFEPCICMVNAQGGHQPGWLANQPDLLATDWEIVA